MDIEEAYRLTDTYIQECERCQSVESVKTLQYNLLIDFTERVGEAKMPSGITDDVYEAIQFIKLHTNAPIGVNDVVNSVCVSKNWLNKKFQEQMNTTIGKYITFCKIEESKSLLAHSDKTLSEISNYFYFSSQSYFQNLFKKQYRILRTKRLR